MRRCRTAVILSATIRLDETDWGGVKVNGIPALRDPKVEPAAAARWRTRDTRRAAAAAATGVRLRGR